MTIYNFSAGPAVLPKEVLKKAQAEFFRLCPKWHECDGAVPPIQGI